MTECNSRTLRCFSIVIVKSHAIDELSDLKKEKKEASRNEWTVGGSSATSPRRNIAAIIFKQAASGRSIFSPVPEGILIADSIARSGYFWDYAKVTLLEMRLPISYHLALAPLSFEPNEPFYSISPFSLTDFPFDEKRVRDNSWRSRGKGGIRWNGEEDGEKEKREGWSWRFLRTVHRTEE